MEMLQSVTVLAAAVTLALAAPNPNPVNIFKIDITPEEAQQYLNSPPFTEPQLSGQTAVLPLVRYDSPQFRTAEAGPTLGHYWKNGQEIENTDDYLEEVYEASQFHGQDGLGAYAYGYKAPESAKVENRARSGDVTGSYTYKAGNNELIKVRYWADSEGFHQEDNLPKVELKPAEETEEVKLARIAHEKAWQEAAAAAAQQPDPQGEYSGAKYENQQSGPGTQQNYQFQASGSAPQSNQYQPSQYQGAASEPHPNIQYQGAASEPQGVTAPREGKAYSSSQGNYQGQQFGQQRQPTQFGQSAPAGQFSQASAQYQSTQYGQQKPAQQQYGQQGGYGQQQGQPEEPEPTGPPRGFFYSFDYPVSIIVRKDAQGQNGPVNPGQPIDHDTVGVNANAQRYG